MRILHLFANWKWTGPAEPALNLAWALRDRGHEVHFAGGREVRPMPNFVANEARSRKFEPIVSLRLGKHRHPIYDPIDRRALRGILKDLRPDLVHCHLPNDHRLALGATRGLGIPVVRSLYDGDVPRSDRDTRTLLSNSTKGLIVLSERMRDGVAARFPIDAERITVVDGAVDLRRFDPTRKGLPRLGREYGLQKGDFVVGIVARMQKHRRFEIFFEALTKAAKELPNLKVLLVGRGTWMDEVAVKPAARKELVGKAIFTGYRQGAEYVATLRCMSVKVYLTPGSDGSCRAVREALAMGIPIVAARRGHLQDLVEDGVLGIQVGDDADELAAALISLAQDTRLRNSMSRTAVQRAQERFGLPLQAQHVEAVYKRVLGA